MLRLTLLLLLAVSSATAQNPFNLLEPNEFELALRKQPEAILIDLRNVDSYTKGHIRKAIVVDFLRDDFREYFSGKYKKDAPIYVYAQSADNSQHAGQYIAELGYKNVTALKGGFENWIRKSKPYKSVGNEFKPLSYVSKQNFHRTIKEKKWTLVVFHEDYCKECEAMDGILKELQAENKELLVTKINFQTNVELAEWLDVIKNPTLILYKDGIQYWKTTGVTTKDKIKQQIY